MTDWDKQNKNKNFTALGGGDGRGVYSKAPPPPPVSQRGGWKEGTMNQKSVATLTSDII